MNNIAALRVGVRAEFDIYVKDTRGHLRLANTGRNLITNIGMDMLPVSSLSSFFNYCRLGESSAAPAYTDTVLGSQVASQSPDGGVNAGTWGTGDYVNKAIYTKTYTFGAFPAAKNLREIGLGGSASGADLRTHALLKDENGAPVEVAVGAGEQPVVVYRLILSPPSSDTTFVTTTSPTTTEYTLTFRPLGIGSYSIPDSKLSPNNTFAAYYGASSGIVPATGGSPTGTRASGESSAAVAAAYVSGSFERTFAYTFGASAGNAADIGAFALPAGVGYGYAPFAWQIGIYPRLTKASPQIISFTIKLTWARDE